MFRVGVVVLGQGFGLDGWGLGLGVRAVRGWV